MVMADFAGRDVFLAQGCRIGNRLLLLNNWAT
jgi:hypothetical protein